ncbi:Protein farnesyltransferase/geranylgeranyltransferase type-1 subunit alpha [Erysiphe neolycopersici]|uniref:Protein farnesyltransferase/geranylgeranyltransferase type-1 subunit alpha n=1 Tax=Erysiphe neolycopersici TaxID=212602 RepID=A0A420HNL9_9PEZI|nr:Protein farnesyltransferase/geranylgeranyltransferase type-1 subunit alpha [Erysiphe neolycopersici]
MGSKLKAETEKIPKSIHPKKSREYSTIATQLEALHIESIPSRSSSIKELTSNHKINHILSSIIETGNWRLWNETQQKEFWNSIEVRDLPIPITRLRDLGKDSRGRDLCQFSPTEFYIYIRKERQVGILRTESKRFREQLFKEEADIEMERNRRKLINMLKGKKIRTYEDDPNWDDVIPIPQEDSERALAAITYTDEYSEAMSYLRAIMASEEHSARALVLTAHIIALNPAHYTVWLYRASIIKALNYSIATELDWLNEIALQNQKNYQIWHHRQLLIDHLYPSIANDSTAIEELTLSETEFMQKMFDEDSKNYHVWSYRQYLVRKLKLFNSIELSSVETLLKRDVRNNSAWSHRFFLVFSNPDHASASLTSFEYDSNIPNEVIGREKMFAKTQILEAPQNPCSWNYLRGVMRKAGQKVAVEEDWVSNFVELNEVGSAECRLIKSSHALEFLADICIEKSEYNKADEAFRLLSDKYDCIRSNYWSWRRKTLKGE